MIILLPAWSQIDFQCHILDEINLKMRENGRYSLKVRVNGIVEKLFITPEMPKILKETLQIQSAVIQGTDKLSRIIFFKFNYIQCDKFIWYGHFINRLHSV